jgi:hypothetical protein
LLETDFSSAIDFDSFITIDTPIAEKTSFAQSYTTYLMRYAASNLTEEDKARLGVWQVAPGRIILLDETIGQVCTHFLETNELPGSGVELFPELLGEAGFAAFTKMTKSEAVKKYGSAIDPITGKFYKSFSSSEWSSGSMDIEIVSDPAIIQEHCPDYLMRYGGFVAPNGRYVEETTGPVELIVTATVYGEVEGSEIFENTLYRGDG